MQGSSMQSATELDPMPEPAVQRPPRPRPLATSSQENALRLPSDHTKTQQASARAPDSRSARAVLPVQPIAGPSRPSRASTSTVASSQPSTSKSTRSISVVHSPPGELEREKKRTKRSDHNTPTRGSRGRQTQLAFKPSSQQTHADAEEDMDVDESQVHDKHNSRESSPELPDYYDWQPPAPQNKPEDDDDTEWSEPRASTSKNKIGSSSWNSTSSPARHDTRRTTSGQRGVTSKGKDVTKTSQKTRRPLKAFNPLTDM
jgi:hypothetical protein